MSFLPRDRASMMRFVRFIATTSGRRFGIALALLVLGGLTEGFSILLVIPLLSLAGNDTGPESNSALQLPDWLGGVSISLGAALTALVLLIALQGVFTRRKNIYLADLLFNLLNTLRLDLFAAIGSLRWDELVRRRPSDLHHLLTADVDRVFTAAMAVMVLLQTGILLVIYLIVAWIISPPMMLISGGLGLVILALLAPLRSRASQFGYERTANKREQYRTVSEYLAGLKTAKIHGAEAAYRARLSANLDKVHAEAVGYMRLTSLGTIMSQVVSALAVATLVYAGIMLMGMGLPQLVAFMLLLMRIAPRFTTLQTNLQQLLAEVTVFGDIERFRAECAAAAEPPARPVSVAPLLLTEAIRCVNVRYAYAGGDGRAALADLDCVIPAKAITALVGPSGSGKSTAADLLCGLLTPQAGTIHIDGLALTPETSRLWRRSIAYVPQDHFLLPGSVAENLCLARPQASEAELWAALEGAGAAGFVRALSHGLDTQLGENGSRLSGGQRQRIALARALVMKPQLLVLDEATSALDWESQAAFARSIEALRGRVTVLVIAHRLSMVAAADHVIAINAGQVVEVGGFADLARGQGPVGQLVAAERSERRAAVAEPAAPT